MDTTHSHNLNADSSGQSAPLRTNKERIEIQSKIQKLQWLLTECIGIEEYELCSQIKTLIQRKYELLTTNQSNNEIE